jgi:two-component system sensor histidine kinase VicK
MLLIGIGIVATVSTFEIALRTNTIWAALVTLGIQTIAIAFFFIEPRYDHITTRLLLFSYLVFYVLVLFTQTDGSAFPLYWVFTYILFAFVGSGGAESFIWIGAQFFILLGGIARHEVFYEPKLGSTSLRLFIYAYVLVTGFAFILDYAAKLTNRRVVTQNKELEETNARYDVILNSVGDGLIATDERGIVTFMNQKACQLLTMDRREIIGQPLTAVLLTRTETGELIPHRERHITKVLTGKLENAVLNQTSKERQYLVRSDGSSFLAGMVISPVRVIGQVRGAIMLFHDMSVEDQIDRAKSEFVSLASHQLRTPLNVVSWYVEKLLSKRKGDLNHHQEDYLKEISTNNERMIRLVSDLLNVSRVELGRIKIKFEQVDIKALIPALLKEVSPIIEQKEFNFNVDVDIQKGVFEKSDESIVTVIIQNLLSNAIKYTTEKGTITFRASERQPGGELIPAVVRERLDANPNGVYISVQDTGIGIPEEQQNKIFSKLFRADNVQSLDVSGTGLGLYVTQSFAEALGGTIWFQSKPGLGSTFMVYLPYRIKA